MNGCVGTTHADVRGELVHFAADGQLVAVGSAVRNQGEAIVAGLRNGDAWHGTQRSRVIEPRFYDGGACPGDGGVALPVRWMLRAALGKSMGHEVGVVFGEDLRQRMGIQYVGMQRVI